jgi:tetratricopeptide (TPR) repeat protein
MSVDDLSFSAFRAIAFGIGIRTCFAVAAGVIVAGLTATAWRLTRKAGLVLLCVAAGVAWLGLLTISEVQTAERISDVITARYYSFTDATRELAQIGLVVVPACVWGIKALMDRKERERRRSLQSTYLRIATRAYLSGDYDRAIAEYSIAIKVDPKRTEIYIKRGQAWWQKGDYDLAIADFDRAMKLDPALAPAYLHRGIVLAARGDHGAAIADFDRATTLRPSDAAAVLYRGLSLAKQGETDRAADDFRHVLKVTNHSDFVEPARFHLAMLEADQASALAS